MNLQSQKAIKTKSNSIKAYYCGVSALALLLLLILLVSIQHFFPFSLAFVFTLIELSFMALFILGNVYTAKSLREPYLKKRENKLTNRERKINHLKSKFNLAILVEEI